MNIQKLLSPTDSGLEMWAGVCRVIAAGYAVGAAWVILGSLVRMGISAEPSWDLNSLGLANHLYPLLIAVGRTVLGAVFPLAVAQYLDFLRHGRTGEGWLGRNIDKLLLLFAAMSLLWAVNWATLEPAALMVMNSRVPEEQRHPVLYTALSNVLPALAAAVYYFGFSDLIRRSRGMVEEARTLA